MREVVILNRVVKVCLTEKVIFEQKSEGGEGVKPRRQLGEDFQVEGRSSARF